MGGLISVRDRWHEIREGFTEGAAFEMGRISSGRDDRKRQQFQQRCDLLWEIQSMEFWDERVIWFTV